MPPFLLVNPRSGSAQSADDLVAEARARGIEVHVLQEGDDLEELARRADADVLGMAGGDGSLGAVAAVAVERGLPFVAIPFGTRNHFARDLGLDTDDPIGALDAFAGVERRVDVGRVAGRVFLNNVSLGLYALLVHRREKHRRRGAVAARLRALALVAKEHRRHKELFVVDGSPVSARVVLVANSAYSFDLFSVGERERIDQGLLHLYVPHGLRRVTWEERAAPTFTIDSPNGHVRAAIDGEPALLEPPVDFAIDPLALRMLLPPEAE